MKNSKLFDLVFFRRKHVCPWWLCFTFDNLFRRFVQNPHQILSPYIREGNTVLDVGAGMGYFSIPMAKMVGVTGRVIAADIQEKMLSALKRRAERSGLQQRITLQPCSKDTLGIKTKIDFILTFWMVHEVPNKKRFLVELLSLLKDDGAFLMVEPKIHVTKSAFEETVRLAEQTGFIPGGSPRVFLSRCVLFAKAENRQTPI